MWEFISGNGIKPPQKGKTDEDKKFILLQVFKKPVLPD
jgi:hypothetical protein